MLYRVSFEEAPHTYTKPLWQLRDSEIIDRLYRSTMVEADAYEVTGEGNIILPALLIDWSKNTWAAQFKLHGELKFTHYSPHRLTGTGSWRPGAVVDLQTIQI